MTTEDYVNFCVNTTLVATMILGKLRDNNKNPPIKGDLFLTSSASEATATKTTTASITTTISA